MPDLFRKNHSHFSDEALRNQQTSPSKEAFQLSSQLPNPKKYSGVVTADDVVFFFLNIQMCACLFCGNGSPLPRFPGIIENSSCFCLMVRGHQPSGSSRSQHLPQRSAESWGERFDGIDGVGGEGVWDLLNGEKCFHISLLGFCCIYFFLHLFCLLLWLLNAILEAFSKISQITE